MEFILRGCCDVFDCENFSLKWKYESMCSWYGKRKTWEKVVATKRHAGKAR